MTEPERKPEVTERLRTIRIDTFLGFIKYLFFRSESHQLNARSTVTSIEGWGCRVGGAGQLTHGVDPDFHDGTELLIPPIHGEDEKLARKRVMKRRDVAQRMIEASVGQEIMVERVSLDRRTAAYERLNDGRELGNCDSIESD